MPKGVEHRVPTLLPEPIRQCENLRCRKALSTRLRKATLRFSFEVREPQMLKGVEHLVEHGIL